MNYNILETSQFRIIVFSIHNYNLYVVKCIGLLEFLSQIILQSELYIET